MPFIPSFAPVSANQNNFQNSYSISYENNALEAHASYKRSNRLNSLLGDLVSLIDKAGLDPSNLQTPVANPIAVAGDVSGNENPLNTAFQQALLEIQTQIQELVAQDSKLLSARNRLSYQDLLPYVIYKMTPKNLGKVWLAYLDSLKPKTGKSNSLFESDHEEEPQLDSKVLTTRTISVSCQRQVLHQVLKPMTLTEERRSLPVLYDVAPDQLNQFDYDAMDKLIFQQQRGLLARLNLLENSQESSSLLNQVV